MRGSILLVCLLMILASWSVPRSFAVGEAEARQAIGDAQNRVSSCYNAAMDAAKAEANVTNLLSTLNGAGSLLSKAVAAEINGNYDSAYSLASQCAESLAGFEGKADALVKTASQEGFVGFMVNVVGPLVSAAAVVLVGVVLWRVLMKKYP